MRKLAIRAVGFLGGAMVITSMTACPGPTQGDGNVPPPGVVVVPPPDQPPPPPVNPPIQENCQALELTAGGTFNCDQLLDGPQYCDTLYPPGQENLANAPDPAGLQTIIDCSSCDGQYGQVPQGAVCAGDPVLPPEPGIDGETCYTCHAPNGYDGQNSIEDPHPWQQQQCTTCHGGDGTATNPVYAHVCPPPAVGNRQQQVLDPRAFFLSFTTAGVQYLDDYFCTTQTGEQVLTSPEMWLNFVNPGDLRSGRSGDINGNPIGCAQCHGQINDAVSRSVMGNATGLNSGTRYGIGADNKFGDRRESNIDNDWGAIADYGATAIANDAYDANERVVGEVPSLYQPEVFTGQGFQFDQTYTADAVNNSLELANINAQDYPNSIANNIAEQLFQEVLNQACTGCHLQNGYNNNRAGDYRSVGCAGCHFQPTVTGRSGSKDPNIDKYEPIDPNNLTPGEKSWKQDHNIRNTAKAPGQGGVNLLVRGVDSGNCITCHEGSNRTVAQYEGYRLDQNEDLTNNNFYPSQNTVTFTYRTQLFGENQFYNNRAVTQWIDTEIWQADAVTQDETAEDVHHAAGMTCTDCHSAPQGDLHGNGKIYSRMKTQTHFDGTTCVTCHGSIYNYAENDGANLLSQAGIPLKHTVVNDAVGGDFWLVSKGDGSLHYIPQTRDTVDATNAGGFGKVYPPGTPKAGQSIFNYTASYAMGRYDNNGGQLQDGLGPIQVTDANSAALMAASFSHSDGVNRSEEGGLECQTCHSSWQNNCIGCHLDAFYDNNPANFFFSQVTGERIYFNFNANFVYQNPINSMLGINDVGRIATYQGLHDFFSYTDINNNTSDRIAYGDRNGLRNDPQLRNQNRNALPALDNNPFTAHSIRSRYSTNEVGMQGCLDCHNGNANNIFIWDQVNDNYDMTATYADYQAAIEFNVNMQLGLGSNLWLFDADGNAVVDTNNAPAYDLDRLVEADGTVNMGSNHPLTDPFGITTNPDYVDFVSTNNARVARPLSGQVLQRLQILNDVGLSDVYYYNSQPGNDPADTNVFQLYLNDYNYFGQ